MNPWLADLDGVVAQGVELAGGGQLAHLAVLQWLDQRARLFADIDRLSAELGAAERQAFHSLLEEICYLDVTILAKAELAMGQVSDELAGLHKLKAFLASGATPAPPSFLHRAL